jgi:hypothetical protein
MRRTMAVVSAALLVLAAGCGFFSDPQRETGPECGQLGCDISGCVRDFQGNPIPGIKIARTGTSPGLVAADAGGCYIVARNSIDWRICLAPADTLWTFVPENRCFTVEGNYTDQDFVGTPAKIHAVSVGGRVTDNVGGPVAGVLITVQGSTVAPVHTDANGDYHLDNIIGGWAYCVVPSKSGYDFEPPQRCYSNLDINRPAENFTATLR